MNSNEQRVVFNALDRNAEIDISERNLPHWFQVGAATFVTFRTHDSLPRDVLLRWQRESQEWLIQRNIVSQSWMRYTARQINRAIGQSGPFWQPEPFDHIIRNDEQFRYLQDYIAANPARANVPQTDCLIWHRDSL